MAQPGGRCPPRSFSRRPSSRRSRTTSGLLPDFVGYELRVRIAKLFQVRVDLVLALRRLDIEVRELEELDATQVTRRWDDRHRGEVPRPHAGQVPGSTIRAEPVPTRRGPLCHESAMPVGGSGRVIGGSALPRDAQQSAARSSKVARPRRRPPQPRREQRPGAGRAEGEAVKWIGVGIKVSHTNIATLASARRASPRSVRLPPPRSAGTLRGRRRGRCSHRRRMVQAKYRSECSVRDVEGEVDSAVRARNNVSTGHQARSSGRILTP